MTNPCLQPPRRRATSDIKLLRLELLPRGDSPCDEIGIDWSPAQPTENLSPEAAAEGLGVELWAPTQVVQKRYRQLQLRYPPEQFGPRHIFWRPSAELLGNSRARLNWFWQSGLIPLFWSELPFQESNIWDSASVEDILSPQVALQRRIQKLLKKEASPR